MRKLDLLELLAFRVKRSGDIVHIKIGWAWVLVAVAVVVLLFRIEVPL